MIVAGLQLDIEWQRLEANFRQASVLADRAVAGGARLLVLPEAFATGFSISSDTMARYAETIRAFLADLARQRQVWVLGGYIEPGDERPVNACSLMTPDGEERLHYRKIHPFSLAGEPNRFESGRQLFTTKVEDIRVTPVICYDLRFVELFRSSAEATDCFVVIANWPAKRAHAWRTLLAARAIDCQAYVLGVNRVGEAEGHAHLGDTALIDPMGEPVVSLDDEPGVALGEVDAGHVEEMRWRYPFLDDRRPDVYDEL